MYIYIHIYKYVRIHLLKDEWSVRLLLDAKAKTDRLSREGRSPLFIAAEKDDASILRLLIEKCNLDVNAPATNEGHQGSPLHIATMFNNVCAISVLLLMGANVYLKVDLFIYSSIRLYLLFFPDYSVLYPLKFGSYSSFIDTKKIRIVVFCVKCLPMFIYIRSPF
jgi:ankyrin repeat protein